MSDNSTTALVVPPEDHLGVAERMLTFLNNNNESIRISTADQLIAAAGVHAQLAQARYLAIIAASVKP